MLRMALAGPGPATMAFRLQQVQFASLRPLLQRAHASSLAKAMSAKSKPAKPNRERLASNRETTASPALASPKKKKKDTSLPSPTQRKPGKPSGVKKKKVSPATASPKDNPIADSPPEVELVTALPPPASAIDTSSFAQYAIEAFQANDLRRAIHAWRVIMDSETASDVSFQEYELLSEELAAILRGPNKLQLRRFAFDEPEAFRVLRHLAIHAAARDKWKGLHDLLLELLGAGQPIVVVETWKEFMKLARQVQGREREDLQSPDRATRIAARLSGDGMMPLILVQVAALTMLNEFDQTAVLTFLETSAGFHGENIRSQELKPVRRRLDPFSAPNPALYKRFLENLGALALCVMCYHPVALSVRISTLGASDDESTIMTLYERIMKFSTGPERLIVPLTADSRFYDVVPLPPSIWRAFVRAFSMNGRKDRIMKLLDVDMPLRYTRTPTAVLGFAMLQLSRMRVRNRRAIRADVDGLWRRICDRGAQDQPEMMHDRLCALTNLNDVEGSSNFYAYAKRELRKRQVTNGDSYVDPMRFSYLCHTRQLEEALALLDDHRPTLHPRSVSAYHFFLRAALLNSMPYSDRRILLIKIMQTKPAGLGLLPNSWGTILAFLLEGGHDLEKACAEIAKHNKGYRGAINHTVFWSPLLGNLLSSTETDRPLRAAVLILERHIPPDDISIGMRLFSTWRSPVTAISRSTCTTAADRHHLLERTMACYPREDAYKHRLILSIILTSLQRPTPDGVPEALFWLGKINRKVIRRYEYKRIISRIVHHGYPQVAGEIVDSLPSGGLSTEVTEFAHSLGVKTGTGIEGDVDDEVGFESLEGDMDGESLEEKEERLVEEGNELLEDDEVSVL